MRTLAITGLALLLCGCATSATETKEAVHRALLDHLGKRQGLDVSKMDVEITQLVFKEGKAEVEAAFRAKGMPGAPAMNMHYTLSRSGGTWVVEKTQPVGEHGATAPPSGQMPAGHPPIPEPRKP
jgi:hypothetical protein